MHIKLIIIYSNIIGPIGPMGAHGPCGAPWALHGSLGSHMGPLGPTWGPWSYLQFPRIHETPEELLRILVNPKEFCRSRENYQESLRILKSH